MLQHWATVHTTSSATVAWINEFVLLCISAFVWSLLDSISPDWFKAINVQFNVNFCILKVFWNDALFYNIQPTHLSIYALDSVQQNNSLNI